MLLKRSVNLQASIVRKVHRTARWLRLADFFRPTPQILVGAELMRFFKQDVQNAISEVQVLASNLSDALFSFYFLSVINFFLCPGKLWYHAIPWSLFEVIQ